MLTSAIKSLNPFMLFQTWNLESRKKEKESNSIVSLYC